jgi:hypothetical protein
MPSLALSFVIPLYKSADTITGVVRDIEGLTIEGGHELVVTFDIPGIGKGVSTETYRKAAK